MEQSEIKELLRVHGITQRELAKRMGITPSTLSQILNGNAKTSSLLRIAKALGVDVSDLYNSSAVRSDADIYLPTASTLEAANSSTQPPRNRAFVICPHCGKEIPLDLYPASDSDNQ